MLKSYKVNSEGIPHESIMTKRPRRESLDEIEKRVNNRKLRRQLYPVKKASRSAVKGAKGMAKGLGGFVKSTNRFLARVQKRMPSAGQVNREIWR